MIRVRETCPVCGILLPCFGLCLWSLGVPLNWPLQSHEMTTPVILRPYFRCLLDPSLFSLPGRWTHDSYSREDRTQYEDCPQSCCSLERSLAGFRLCFFDKRGLDHLYHFHVEKTWFFPEAVFGVKELGKLAIFWIIKNHCCSSFHRRQTILRTLNRPALFRSKALECSSADVLRLESLRICPLKRSSALRYLSSLGLWMLVKYGWRSSRVTYWKEHDRPRSDFLWEGTVSNATNWLTPTSLSYKYHHPYCYNQRAKGSHWNKLICSPSA